MQLVVASHMDIDMGTSMGINMVIDIATIMAMAMDTIPMKIIKFYMKY